MQLEGFWKELYDEVNGQTFLDHPIYTDMAAGTLKKATIAEMLAQIKYCVTEGISSLALIIPLVPRPLKAELAENIYGELAGTPKVPSHWELALRTGAAAGYSEDDIDARPMMPETKIYPDTVAAYAGEGKWVEALSFVAIGIEDLFHEFSAKTAAVLRKNYGFDDAAAFYFDVHVEADEEHGRTGWNAAMAHATTDAAKQSVRRASLQGRNMWWNMYSAVYEKEEGKPAPRLTLDS